MNLRRTLLSLSFLLLAAGRLPAAAVWFTSAPSPVESGQGYYVEAYAFGYYEDSMSLTLYKNWGWFASGGGWTDAMAGNWTSDGGPQTVDYLAEAYDPYDGSAWTWASVTVNGTPPPANNPPNAWVEVDGYGHTATVVRPYGGTVNITVRYKAGDADGNLARIRPQVWHPATGLFTNDGGGWTGQGGGYGEVVRTITLDRNGDWYFWSDAEDTNNVFVNSGAWGDAFRLSVVEGAPPNSPPAITLLSPAAQTITVGTALTISSHSTDANGNLTHHHLDIQRPDGSWNWQGGFANGEPYNGGPVGSAANSTRTAAFTFNLAGTWHVRSWANDSAGANLHSATVAITVNSAPDTTPPGSPQNLAVSGLTASAFTLTWSAPSGEAATGYRVRLNEGAATAVLVLSHTFTGLAANSSFIAQVSARDAAGNWSDWIAAGATTGGSGGGTVAGSSAWRDIDGDGLLDEVVQPNTPGFDYYINTWYTENVFYAFYPINNYWQIWNDDFFGASFFSFLWWGEIFWAEYETHFELVFSVLEQANEPLAIYRDTSGSHVINPATWGAPILNLPNGFPTAGTQHLNWPLPGPNDLPGVKYFLVKKGLPVGNVQLTDSFGVSLGTALPGGVLNVLLPGNGHLVVKAKDLIGRILGVANNGVVFSVKNALGQLINLPNNGLLDILDIGIDQNGTWQIGVKQGGQSDGQTIWFNVNVAANPDLDVVYPATGLLSETRELQEGGLVPIRRDAGTPITKLRLNPVNDTNGTYRLSWANSKINIWRDAARTIPVVSDQTTFPANVDTDVFLEGVTKSSAIKDVQVILKLTGPSGDMAQSSVPLTVVDAEFDIQAKFWIREQWINVPWTPVDNFFYNKIAGGDDRDNSNSPGALYRVTQLVTVIPYADLDADGIKDTFAGISYNRKLAGISTLYNKPTSVPSPSDPYSASNRLLSAASPTNSGTADLSRVYLDPLARTANNVIQTRLHGAANDPLITFSSDIDWDITIDIDGANVLVPKFNIAGGRDEYPALEIDIGDSIGRRSPQPFFWLHPLPSNVFGLMGGTLTPLPTPIQGNVR